MTIGDGFEAAIEAAKAGEEWAFNSLYTDLHPLLLRYLRAHEPGAADDLAAETWMAAAHRLAGFNGNEAGWRAWMFTIARNRLASYRRTSARRKTFPVSSSSLADYPSSTLELADASDAALENLSASEAVDLLAKVLRPDHAEVILLRVLGGFSVNETARMMGKRPGSIRVLQHRALQHLRKALGEPTGPRNKRRGSGVPGEV